MNLQPKSSEMEKLTCLSLWECSSEHFTIFLARDHSQTCTLTGLIVWRTIGDIHRTLQGMELQQDIPVKTPPVSLLYWHYLCTRPDLGTTAWTVMSGPKSNKYSCMRASQLQRTSRLIIATRQFAQFWNKSTAKQNKQGLDKTKNAVVMLLSCCHVCESSHLQHHAQTRTDWAGSQFLTWFQLGWHAGLKPFARDHWCNQGGTSSSFHTTSAARNSKAEALIGHSC